MALTNGHASQNGTSGFLSFNAKPPLVWITGDDKECDETTLRYWKEEGFTTQYLQYDPTTDASAFMAQLKTLGNSLPLGTSYALIAYGNAASLVLRAATKPMPKLCALVDYYPSTVPNPRAKYPALLEMVVHLAGTQAVPPTEFKSYMYAGTAPGFAERKHEAFEGVEAGLAWGRTLGCVKKGFKMEPRADVEVVWERNLQGKFDAETDDEGALQIVNTMTSKLSTATTSTLPSSQTLRFAWFPVQSGWIVWSTKWLYLSLTPTKLIGSCQTYHLRTRKSRLQWSALSEFEAAS